MLKDYVIHYFLDNKECWDVWQAPTGYTAQIEFAASKPKAKIITVRRLEG